MTVGRSAREVEADVPEVVGAGAANLVRNAMPGGHAVSNR